MRNWSYEDLTALANQVHDDNGRSPLDVLQPGDTLDLSMAPDPRQLLHSLYLGGGTSPDPMMGLEQFLGKNGMTLQQYQQMYGGLPINFSEDGKTATYAPEALRNNFSYEKPDGAMFKIAPALIAAMATAGMSGMLPGTTSIFGGAGAGAGAGATAGSFSSSIPLAEGISALSAAPGALGGAAGGTFGANAGLAEMIASISQGGTLASGTIPSVAGLSGAGMSSLLAGSALPAISGPLGSFATTASELIPSGINLANSATSAPGLGSNTGATASIPKTAAGTLSSLLKEHLGVDVNPGTLDLIGKGLGVGLGMYGSNQQANASQDLANQYMGMGAPYRAELANLNANPGQFYESPMVQGALQQGSDALSRSLSAKVGNPILNPTALQEMQNYTSRGLLDAYNQRFGQLANAGQLGTGPAANLGTNAIQQQGNTYNALGAGIQSVFGNQRDYAGELLDAMKSKNSGGFSLA